MPRFNNISGLSRMRRLVERPRIKFIRDSIKEAIENNLKIDFLYQDTKAGNKVLSGYRSVIPVALGVHASSGRGVVRGYLVEGVSKSGASPKWRLWRLDRMKAIRIYYNPSKIPSGYSKNDKHMGTIISQK